MTEEATTVPSAGMDATGNGQPQGTEGTNATSLFAPEFANHPSIQKFGNDPNKLAKSYLALESMMGQGRVSIPKDENDLNAWGLYDKAFGVPEKADGYQLKAPDGTDLSGFNELMRQNHIPPAVAQKLLDAHLEDYRLADEQRAQQAEVERQNAEAALKKEWGLKFQENMSKAAKFLEKISETKEDYDYFDQKIGNDPKFVKLLARMGSQISEGSLGGMEGQVGGFTKTPTEAKAELDKILSDPNDAYFAGLRNHRNDPKWCREHNQGYVSEEERKARVAYVSSLMQMQG